jgi:phosphoglycerol transferase
VLRFLVYFSAFFLAGLAGWIDRTFGEPSIDQILYHLRFSEGAAVHMSGIFLGTFAVEVLAFPLLFTAGAMTLHALLERWQPGWPRAVLRFAPGALTAGAGTLLLLQFSFFSYAHAWLKPDAFTPLYVPPARVTLETPARPKNLILIYGESIEATYGDASVFGSDLLAPLRDLGGVSFANYQPAPGATWTIAAMVGTQCGVPLSVYSEAEMKRKEGARVFLPRAVCLGDLLRDRGYRNVFLGGAPLSFAGKDAFLRDHGYDAAYGSVEWAREGVKPTELNEWGLYDGALFARARTQLKALHDAGRPFNLTLLTINTHNPHGFLSPRCRAEGARDFGGIVTCSMAQVASFVAYAREQGYLENTVVAIMGDHLAVPNPVYDDLLRAPHRSIYNRFIATPDVVPARQDLVTFDMYPTLLDALGWRVPGGRIGLGYSAIAPQAGQPPADRLDDLAAGALGGSSGYRELWDQR